MVLALIIFAATFLWVPAVWGWQALRDWWTNPDRAFWRRVWLVEHDLAFLTSERSAQADRPAPVPFTGHVDHPGAGSQPPIGSAVATASVEPPAPGNPITGAGTDRGSVTVGSHDVEPQPAPGAASPLGAPGAGPLPLSAVLPTPGGGQGSKPQAAPTHSSLDRTVVSPTRPAPSSASNWRQPPGEKATVPLPTVLSANNTCGGQGHQLSVDATITPPNTTAASADTKCPLVLEDLGRNAVEAAQPAASTAPRRRAA
ncbi:hypothetical protein [Kibdelosporangium philippinense]|uniref:hypothetical protein n=1 Tax=Kibdelosporangium philippinense TaxID=211113 RepID=UPI0036149D9C